MKGVNGFCLQNLKLVESRNNSLNISLRIHSRNGHKHQCSNEASISNFHALLTYNILDYGKRYRFPLVDHAYRIFSAQCAFDFGVLSFGIHPKSHCKMKRLNDKCPSHPYLLRLRALIKMRTPSRIVQL